MLNSYQAAAAPGTQLNRRRQASLFLKFALTYNVNYFNPSPLEAAWYVQFLANTYKSVTTIKNYISGARTWILQHNGNPMCFSNHQVQEVLKGITKKSTHVPAPAPPLTPHQVRIICQFLDRYGLEALPVKAAILIGFTCFLRSSNLVLCSSSEWEGPHTLKASDLHMLGSKLNVIIRSSKTISPASPVVLEVQSVPDSTVCPVYTWSKYLSYVRPPAAGPAFILKSGRPLTSRPIVSLMRLALQNAGVKHYKLVSMHSLRRGGVQAAEDMGASDIELKAHGTWRSDKGLKAYKKPNTMVPRCIASSLAF